jgi:hypothetical protein
VKPFDPRLLRRVVVRRRGGLLVRFVVGRNSVPPVPPAPTPAPARRALRVPLTWFDVGGELTGEDMAPLSLPAGQPLADFAADNLLWHRRRGFASDREVRLRALRASDRRRRP